MSSVQGAESLSYRRLARAELSAIRAIELDPLQVERFLGPIEDILAAVGRGPAHSLIAIECGPVIVGFYVVHPDRRDASCWWLGWFALDRRQQGRGYGHAAIAAVLDRLRHVDGCRRVRLLVAPDNLGARHLYAKAGFSLVDTQASTGELVLERTMAGTTPVSLGGVFDCPLVVVRSRRAGRGRRLRPTVGPHAARVIGVERGPPQ
jgi:GNAT superfamily N-acetyltransferase